MQMILFYLFSFLFGICLGSFLNVLAFRYGTERSAILARSQCLSCGKTLSWLELIPLLSFVFQKGRCRNCLSQLSLQYPLVELLSGLMLVLILWKVGLFQSFPQGEFLLPILEALFFTVIFSILMVIAVYDYWHKIIPDALVFTFIGLSFLYSVFTFGIPDSMLQALLSGPLIASPFFLIWFISKGGWMGFGDVKLALGMGYFLGLTGGVYAFLWSFWIGGIFSIILLLATFLKAKLSPASSLSSHGESFTMKSEVPFGPFMILGTAVAFFMEWDFLGFALFFNF